MNRIYFRNVTENDVTDAYYNWMNDPEVNQYLEARFRYNTKEDIADFIYETNLEPDTIFYAICLKKNDVHIGNIKLWRINQIHKFAEVSILIGLKQYWGKGYATEAIKLLCEYAFKVMRLNKLTAECYALNKGSYHAFTKAGFKIEGKYRLQYKCKDRYIDSYLLGFLQSEYNQRGRSKISNIRVML